MLGDELHRQKQLQVSKSSMMGDEENQRRLREMIEERDNTIRKLSRKINKLEATLKKSILTRALSDKERQGSGDGNNYLEMLKMEVNKTKHLEDTITLITRRINAILQDLAQDNSFTDNSEELKQMLEELDMQNNSFSLDYLEQEGNISFNISQEWIKNIDILQGTIKSFKVKCMGFKQQAKNLSIKNEELAKAIDDLNLKLKDNDQIRYLQAQLKEERKKRQKLRGILDRTELEKNEIQNKIRNISLKEAEINARTMEELLQYSRELNYRVKDLQKQKEAILKESTKGKETQLRKYQDFLRKLKKIKETSRLGKSFD